MLSQKPKPTGLILATLLTICSAAFGQFADPDRINQQIGRGINLGNALEAPSEGEWGVTLEERYFDLIRDAGFDSIRLPVRWNAHAMTEAPYTIDADFFRRVDWAVDNTLRRNLPIIVNIHHYNDLDQDPQGHMDRFLALWKQIAEHYKDKPNTLIFELMNEPHDKLNATAWNMILDKAIKVIRESNPNRTLMVGPVQWNQIAYLKHLELPEDDDNIIVTVHYYLPMKFTHQGASWAADSNEWLGTEWTGSEEEKKAVSSDFDIADAWASENDRPLHLGEFGAYSAADMESRARWTKFIADSAIDRGWSFSYWEFCSGFGVYDPAGKQWREPLLDALLPNR